MSALARSPRALDGWRRPSLFGLLAAVLGGEVLAAVVLWIIGVALTMAGVGPVGGAQNWVWLPWQIDGLWALLGALGWGYLVAALVAGLVANSIERRHYARPAAGWLRLAIAISGYGAMAVGHTAGAHIFVAVVAGAVVIRCVAFNRDGSPRAWRWELPRRARVAGVIAAALVALSYSGTHAFTVDGGDGSGGTLSMRVGHTASFAVGLSQTRLPVDVTRVTLTGAGTAHIRVTSALTLGGVGAPSLRLPEHVGAGTDLWITIAARLISCGPATVNRLVLHYTVLGIATSERIPLQQPLSLSCRR